MQYQSDCLQQDATIEFLPHGSDLPYRIVTINNPIVYLDPSGHLAIRIGLFAGFGGEISYDFDTGKGSIGVGVGVGSSFSVSDGDFSVGCNVGANAQVGYSSHVNSFYASSYAGAEVGGYGASVSVAYYFAYDRLSPYGSFIIKIDSSDSKKASRI